MTREDPGVRPVSDEPRDGSADRGHPARETNRIDRERRIREILSRHRVETQEELVELLRGVGPVYSPLRMSVEITGADRRRGHTLPREQMNVHQLELFFHVVLHQGVSPAARALEKEQPTLSKQINDLEDSLRAKLYHRRPFRLTEKGEILFRSIEPFSAAFPGSNNRSKAAI